MKKAIKIINIVTGICWIVLSVVWMILAILAFVGGAAVGGYYGGSAGAAAGALVGIPYIICFVIFLIGAIFSFVANKHLAYATCKKDMLKWGILLIIFANVVSGVMILACPDSQYAIGAMPKPQPQPQPNPYVQPAPQPAPAPSNDVAAQLGDLKKLHEMGVLTDAEYEAKRAEVISKL